MKGHVFEISGAGEGRLIRSKSSIVDCKTALSCEERDGKRLEERKRGDSVNRFIAGRGARAYSA